MLRLLLTVLVVGFALYCLLDVARTPEGHARGLPRVLWVVVVIVFPLLGGFAWLVAGRPRITRPPGADGGAARPAARGPDDDADFLRSLDGHARRKRESDDSGDNPTEGDQSS